MISEAQIKQLLENAFENVDVAVFDKTGAMDHFRLYVSTTAFEGKSLIEQHQMVYKALDEAMKDGRIHAVEITTDVPKPSQR